MPCHSRFSRLPELSLVNAKEIDKTPRVQTAESDLFGPRLVQVRAKSVQLSCTSQSEGQESEQQGISVRQVARSTLSCTVLYFVYNLNSLNLIRSRSGTGL